MLTCTNWGSDRHTMIMLYRGLIRSRLDYGCMAYSSASERVLLMLDSVHHSGLRIATGAFRSSPAISLCAEAGEPPLRYRRAKLSLSYLAQISARPHHPLHHDLTNTLTHQPPINGHVKKCFKERVLSLLHEFNINMPKILTLQQPLKPPWICKQPTFLMHLTKFIKKDTSPILFKNEFHILKDKYPDATFIYTDGSKCSVGVGSCVVCDHRQFRFSLPHISSNFTAEMTAIAKAVHLVIPTHNNTIIFSDSLAALIALQDIFSTQPLVRDALTGIESLIRNGVSVYLCWIPGHCGIEGNELADQGAKAAITDGSPLSGVTHGDFIAHIKDQMFNTWNAAWNQNRDNKLREIKSTTRPWLTSYQENRRDEVVLCRLRIGHTRLTHGYLMSRDTQAICRSCGVHLTIKHILTECLAYQNERNKFKILGTLDEILSNSAGKVINLLQFLKLTNIYKEI